jgi:hypothetical protein
MTVRNYAWTSCFRNVSRRRVSCCEVMQ